MKGQKYTLAAVSTRRLQRHPNARARNSGSGLIIALPIRSRPIPVHFFSSIQRRIWAIFQEPKNMGQAIEELIKEDPEIDAWSAARAIASLERRCLLVLEHQHQNAGIPLSESNQSRSRGFK